jgi:molybdate transport system substrate-binding protein
VLLFLNRAHRLACLIIAALLLAPLEAHAGTPENEQQPLRVFAAASLTEVLQQLATDYAATGATEPRLSFAASSQLARQIEAGAPADMFVSADQEWMDYVVARNLIQAGTRRDIAGNTLVLIAPVDSTIALRLAHQCAGRYAHGALMSLGAWPAVADRLARAENVRIALSYVARAEAPLGIVYATDARTEPRVRIVDSFPEDSHLPIRYAAALLRSATPGAAAFLEFLEGDVARRRFRERGFVSPANR